MATSGTFTFEPTFNNIIEEACERVGIDPAEAMHRHLITIMRSAELMFSSWANKGRREWLIEQKEQTLTQGTNSYTMPTGAITVTDMTLKRTTGGDTYETLMIEISRRDFISLADKTIQGRPTQYFVDREIDVPTLFLWNTPENSTDIIVYNYLRRQHDAGDLSDTLDIPYRWFDAMAAELAFRIYPKLYALAGGKYDHNRYTTLSKESRLAFHEANIEERETAPTRLKVRLGLGRRGRRGGCR